MIHHNKQALREYLLNVYTIHLNWHLDKEWHSISPQRERSNIERTTIQSLRDSIYSSMSSSFPGRLVLDQRD